VTISHIPGGERLERVRLLQEDAPPFEPDQALLYQFLELAADHLPGAAQLRGQLGMGDVEPAIGGLLEQMPGQTLPDAAETQFLHPPDDLGQSLAVGFEDETAKGRRGVEPRLEDFGGRESRQAVVSTQELPRRTR